MFIAILADIHSNLEALEAVLVDCERLKVNQYICLGDIVGYGANPNECVAKIKKIRAQTVAGNHDWACIGKLDPKDFNEVAHEAVLWTEKILNQDSINFLKNLNLVEKTEHFIYVHGSLNESEKFHYLFNFSQAKSTFVLMDRPLCFVGHTHVPSIFESQGKRIVNVGSVGQPRDGDPRACYALFDRTSRNVQIRRVSYDISKAQQKILEAGLPEVLAVRLSLGQ